ncbi:MAG TPA: two-component regulator propeller domain-containing protein [Candidatus Acidoferrales bacterium]|nr:two-component regulator propeller domain-containing protein [Candidatus Acidoferrales bacterium]
MPGLLLAIFVLGFSPFTAFAAPAHYENPDYLIDNWQGSDAEGTGLQENSASCLAQTPDGHIWVGTYGGLVRFNGNDFDPPGTSTNAPQPGETINRLHVDRAGRLWVATEKRIVVLEKNTWREVTRFPDEDLVVRSIAEDAAGQIWCGTLVGKLFTIKNDRLEEVKPPSPLFPSGVFCCTDKKDGSLWVANRGYIGHLTDQGWQPAGPDVADRKPLVAVAARDGGLWVYFQTRHELLHYHADGSVETFTAPGIIEMREIFEDHSGLIWIGSTLSGLTRFRPGDTNSSLAITITNGLANNVVIALMEDVENNLWVGTGSGGLHRLVARRFSNIGLAQGLPNPICRSIIEESPGHYLVGTHGGGMARVQDGRVVSVHRAPDEMSSASSFIWTELRDHDGRIWLGTYNGGVLTESNGVEYAFPGWPATLSKTVNALYEDSQNRIWVGTYSGLGIIENNRMRMFLAESNEPLAKVNVRVIAEDRRAGAFWFGTYDHGLFRVQNGQITHFGPDEGVPAGHVSALTIGTDGTVWAGIFEKGLVGIRDHKVIGLNRDNGLPADTVGSIVEDGLGYVWLGSDHGILRVTAADLDRIWESPSAQIAFNVFDLNDGLVALECAEAFQNTALRDQAGRLWFATQKGVATVDPRSVRLTMHPPPVVIERVTYTDRDGNKIVRENPGALPQTLPAGATELIIKYAALSYTAPDKIRFACRLDGPHSTWAETNRLRTQIFHTLAPGEYFFGVRAANHDGIWSAHYIVFPFTVEPFIWQTVWFWALALLGLAAAVGFGGWRLARIQLHHQLEKLKLQREQVRLAAVLEATSDLVVFTDADRNILHINPAGKKLLGVDGPAAPAVLKWSDLYLLKEYQRMETEGIPAAEKAGTWEGETLIRDRTGREIPVSAVIIVDKDAAGKINFISAIARDISERKSAEEKHARLEEQLRQSQKMEAVGRLSGGVAHDFNNLLAVIAGNVSLMELDETLRPNQLEALDEIKQASDRAAALTRQLLAFSRRQTMKPANLDLNTVVENMGKMFRRILTEEIRLKLAPAPGPVVVHADVGMIEQVLLNLAVNARDAMPGGGELEMAITTVTSDAAPAGNGPGKFAVLTVKDSGCGIAPEILPRIFEPFFTTKDVGKGTGLGLATVYGIVQQHKGWVEVQSQPGKGTSFHIYLPLLDGAKTATAAPNAPLKGPGGSETILVVEDEAAVRKLVTRTLTQLGYQIIEAANGREALEIWEKNRSVVRLVLTDMVMPEGISGLELARRLRLQEPQLKIVFMSGYNAEIVGKTSELVDGLNFIPKPFNQFQLATIVRASLNRN